MKAKNVRKLALAKTTLKTLAGADLARVAGGLELVGGQNGINATSTRYCSAGKA